MREFLYGLIEAIAKVHQYILQLNDSYETNFTDKELHFLVIGLIGVFLLLIIYPLFKWLARKNKVMVITWIYVFTLIVGLTFAIEIGQRLTSTGTMDFADVMFGVVGFLVMFAICMVIRLIYHLIWKLIHYVQKRSAEKKMASKTGGKE